MYESRLLRKHLEESTTDPVTGEAITEDVILPVKGHTAVKPRDISGASVSGLLRTFQTEWDALMLETFKLKQALDQSQSQLALALYKQDAARRVIARLLTERDEARAALASAQAAAPPAPAAEPTVEPTAQELVGDAAATAAAAAASSGMPADLVAQIDAASAELSSQRKSKAVPAGCPSAASWEAAGPSEVYAYHNSRKSAVKCVAVAATPAGHNLLLTGGSDGTAQVFSVHEERVLVSAVGHGCAVTAVAWADQPADEESGAAFVTGSSAGVVRLWNSAGEQQAELEVHSGEVLQLLPMPVPGLMLSIGADGAVQLLNIADAALACTATRWEGDGTVTAAALHPDGVFVGLGISDGVVVVRDVRTGALVAQLQGHSGAVTSVSFSETGYHAATTSTDGTVQVWDLRKAASVWRSEPAKPAPSAVAFDTSGQYIAWTGAKTLHIASHKKKQVTELAAVAISTGAAGVAWAPQSTALAVPCAKKGIVVVAPSS